MRHARCKHKGQRGRDGEEGRETKEGGREKIAPLKRGTREEKGGLTSLESTFSCIIDAVSCVVPATW